MTDFCALLGVKGGPAIRPGSNMPTSILVSLAGRTVLVDAGLGVTRSLCDQGIDLREVTTIFVTHLHSDHYLELGPLLHTAWTAGLVAPVRIFGPAGLERYWQGFLASMKDDIDLRIADEGRVDLAGLVTIHHLDEGPVLHEDGFAVTALRNDHPPLVDTFALRFEAGGKRLVLSGDTAFMEEMATFAKGADLLVHEAMLTVGVEAVISQLGHQDDRLRQHILRSHTPADMVGRVARLAGVRHLALNHFVPDGFPGFGDADWTQEVRRAWDGGLTLGKDGLRIEF
ncbi:MBL fold metallo-hydrolase [Shimia biformata]|uniref:MBL fold metallo-hydrolase n=1 Tax=Shimia biformata TaxID=1294299 RepID=UPI00194F0753|nr:MBL fold metallo-hydrolase [Shimia biformata]